MWDTRNFEIVGIGMLSFFSLYLNLYVYKNANTRFVSLARRLL